MASSAAAAPSTAGTSTSGPAALGGVKIRTAVEEHGEGKQLLRARVWPRTTAAIRLVVLIPTLLALVAFQQGEPALAIALAVGAILMVVIGLEGMATATRLAVAEIEGLEEVDADADEPESAATAPSARTETRLGLAAMEERR